MTKRKRSKLERWAAGIKKTKAAMPSPVELMTQNGSTIRVRATLVDEQPAIAIHLAGGPEFVLSADEAKAMAHWIKAVAS